MLPARPAIGDDAQVSVVADLVDDEHLAREEVLATLQDRLEHGRRVGNRAADRRQHFAGRPLLIERFLGLVEQSNVFERDRGLIAEGSEQRDLALRERPHLLPPQQDHAERVAFAE